MAFRFFGRPQKSRPLSCGTTYRPALEQLEDRITPSAFLNDQTMGHTLSAPVHLNTIQHPALVPLSSPAVTTQKIVASSSVATVTSSPLVTINLNPLDLNLLGLEVKTNQIQVTISTQPGQGELLGNALTTVTSLVNLQGVNNALNNVLGSVVTLLNSTGLSVNGVNTGGQLGTAQAATTPILNLSVAPVHLNLLGTLVDTSPINVSIIAHSGQGLVLGNVVADLANLLNTTPKKFTLDYINNQLQALLTQLQGQLTGIASAPTTTPTLASGTKQVLSLTVPPINLNLLGLNLQTSQIQVNANAQAGNGNLLGNLLTSVLNTLNATPQQISTLNANLNALLAQVVGVLNASSLTLAPNAISSLSQVLQTLASPNLINATGTASAPILNLAIASTNGATPPINVNLLGLQITTSNIQAQLLAQTGPGQFLGNLLYNVANLLNPGGSITLLTILNQISTLTSQVSNASAATVSAHPAAASSAAATVTPAAPAPLVTLNLNPLDVNLLGLEVKTSPIQVTISAQPGQGDLLGNALNTAASLVNLQGISNAVNNVLGSVVTLLNSASLSVNGVNTGGQLGTAQAATMPILDLYVAPVHLNLLGMLVDTSPIHVTITAHSGQGLVLGNVVADLANLLNSPPKKLNLNDINNRLQNLLTQLNNQIPGIGSAPTTIPTPPSGTQQVLSLTVPPINLNLLGLNLQTSQIQVNANAQAGNGNLLGNLLTDALNALDATPQQINTLNANLNALLAKVIGVLNASSLTLAPNAVNSLSQVLQALAAPNLINTTGTASAPILNLAIASNNGSTPPVNVNLLGLQITTSNIQAQLLAQTGNGQVLGNLLYNVANLLNPGESLGLLTILNELS